MNLGVVLSLYLNLGQSSMRQNLYNRNTYCRSGSTGIKGMSISLSGTRCVLLDHDGFSSSRTNEWFNSVAKPNITHLMYTINRSCSGQYRRFCSYAGST